MPKRSVTIKQVARLAGVSPQTVSRVTSNHPDVAPATRARVQGLVTQLGYHPNAVARSLIRQRSQVLGVVITGLTEHTPSRLLVGIEHQAAEEGYLLLPSLLPYAEFENVESVLKLMLAWQVDGLIWAVPEVGHNRQWVIERLPTLPVPIVFFNMEPLPEVTVVTVDEQACGRLAAEHLLAQGRRRLGTLTGPLHSWEAQQRTRGWTQALAAAGVQAPAAQQVAGTWYPPSGKWGLGQLLEQCPDLEAVFVQNDPMALGVLAAARQLGRRVPADLLVVSVDNMREAAYFTPSLTSIQLPLIQAGRACVRQLVQLIRAGQADHTHGPLPPLTLAPKLKIRASSGVS